MARNRFQIAFTFAVALLVGTIGCNRPELTKEELGTVHYSIPQISGADERIAFPKPRATVAVVQPSSPTLAAVESSQPPAVPPSQTPATQPAVQSTGSTLPPSQPGTQPATHGTPAAAK